MTNPKLDPRPDRVREHDSIIGGGVSVFVDTVNVVGKRQLRTFQVSSATPGSPLVRVWGCHANGDSIRGLYLEFHEDDIDTLIRALRLVRAGPLGRMAIRAEHADCETTVVGGE